MIHTAISRTSANVKERYKNEENREERKGVIKTEKLRRGRASISVENTRHQNTWKWARLKLSGTMACLMYNHWGKDKKENNLNHVPVKFDRLCKLQACLCMAKDTTESYAGLSAMRRLQNDFWICMSDPTFHCLGVSLLHHYVQKMQCPCMASAIAMWFRHRHGLGKVVQIFKLFGFLDLVTVLCI